VVQIGQVSCAFSDGKRKAPAARQDAQDPKAAEEHRLIGGYGEELSAIEPPLQHDGTVSVGASGNPYYVKPAYAIPPQRASACEEVGMKRTAILACDIIAALIVVEWSLYGPWNRLLGYDFYHSRGDVWLPTPPAAASFFRGMVSTGTSLFVIFFLLTSCLIFYLALARGASTTNQKRGVLHQMFYGAFTLRAPVASGAARDFDGGFHSGRGNRLLGCTHRTGAAAGPHHLVIVRYCSALGRFVAETDGLMKLRVVK
jgi:hypothetical protein